MSIRGRLLIALAAITLVAIVGADVATYTALRSYLFGQVDSALELSHRPVEASVSGAGGGTGGGGGGAPPPSSAPSPPNACPDFDGQSVNTQGLSPGTFIEVRSTKSGIVYRCTIAEFETTHKATPQLPTAISGFSANTADLDEPTVYFTVPAVTGATTFRVRASVLRSGAEAGGQLVVAVPLTSTVSVLDRLRDLELIVAGAALVVALFLGWWLIRASLHPLRDVERTADAIAAGQLTQRVPTTSSRTEVGRVARAFNVMLERIQAAFAQRDRTEASLRTSEALMRQFIADASHELRTPLAAVTAYSELFDRGAADRPDDLHRVIKGIRDESGRMTHLVEDLLLLARLDEGRPLDLEELDLVEIAAESARTASAVGPEWPIRLVADGPVILSGDVLRLRQALDNLLSNVRVHCPPGTETTIAVSKNPHVAVIDVSDNGPGLTAEEAGQVFERFIRADSSRSRHQGGAGLGLAIVDAIVRAHGGTVTVTPEDPVGTCFSIHLPTSELGVSGPVG